MTHGTLALLAWLMPAWALAAPDAGATKEPTLKVGQTTPHFVMKTVNPKLAGRPVVSTRKIVGSTASTPGRGLVLSFAAEYCKPCKRELPEFIALAKEVADPSVTWAVVLIDKDDAGREAMQRWLVDELKSTVPVLADRFTLLARRFGADQLPYLVVVDRKGVVRWIRTGFEESTLQELRKAVASLPPVDGQEVPRQ